MKLELLGTGTPTPSTKRKSSGYKVTVGNEIILLDLGPGSYHRLLETGTKVQNVTHCFFTHLHYDHFSEYPTLVLTHWDQGVGQVPELKVFGPPPLKRITEQLFSEGGVFGVDLIARTKTPGSLSVYQARGGKLPRKFPEPNVTEVKNGQIIEGTGWTVKVGPAKHTPFLTCHAYRLESAEGSVMYTGDSAPSDDLIELARDADVLIHMCHYRSGTLIEPFNAKITETVSGHLEAAQVARNANVKSLVLTHFTEYLDVPSIKERLIAEVAQVFSGHIYFGEDRQEIPIHGPAKKIMS